MSLPSWLSWPVSSMVPAHDGGYSGRKTDPWYSLCNDSHQRDNTTLDKLESTLGMSFPFRTKGLFLYGTYIEPIPFFFSYLIANVRLLTSPLAAKFTTPMAYTLAALRLRRLANTFQQIKNATAKIDISAVCGEVLGFSCPSPWLWRA